jgi:hypothetical protein
MSLELLRVKPGGTPILRASDAESRSVQEGLDSAPILRTQTESGLWQTSTLRGTSEQALINEHANKDANDAAKTADERTHFDYLGSPASSSEVVASSTVASTTIGTLNGSAATTGDAVQGRHPRRRRSLAPACGMSLEREKVGEPPTYDVICGCDEEGSVCR